MFYPFWWIINFNGLLSGDCAYVGHGWGSWTLGVCLWGLYFVPGSSSLSLFLAAISWAIFLSHNLLPWWCVSFQIQGSRVSPLWAETLKPWTKIYFSSSKLFSSDVLVTETKSWLTSDHTICRLALSFNGMHLNVFHVFLFLFVFSTESYFGVWICQVVYPHTYCNIPLLLPILTITYSLSEEC